MTYRSPHSMAESDLHRHALQTLRRYGWQRRRLGNTEVGFCLIGAYQHNQLRTVDRWPAIRRLQRLCGDKDLARWQDRWYRRRSQVLALIERAYGEAVHDEIERLTGTGIWCRLRDEEAERHELAAA